MNIRQTLLIALLAAATLPAQTNGVIVGRVTDPSGAQVPSAKVELVNQNTGIKAATTASGQGEYVFPRVSPGTYQLTVSAPGFKTIVRNDIPLLVNQTAREDVALAVGDVASSVQVEAEIPVVGHLGLTPQSVHRMGGFRVQARTTEAVLRLKADAHAIADAGAGVVVLEGIPREVAAAITVEISVPTIGIGAGPDCDGQILVFHDLVSLTFAPPAKFVRRYADAGALLREAV